VTRCGEPAGSAGACRRRDCTCLTLGPDRRLDLPMESSMRPAYDNSGHHSPQGEPPATGYPTSSCVSYATFLRPSRSLTVAGGQVRTSADSAAPAPACGRFCVPLTVATLWMQEPT
jgi:hypothetical protein